MRILHLCQQRGHVVEIYTLDWQGAYPDNAQVHVLTTNARTNHRRAHQFSQAVANKLTMQSYDCVVGFNRMLGIDVYFAADVCFAWKIAQQHAYYYRYLPRYSTYLKLERELFQQANAPHCLFLTPMQQTGYQTHYGNC